MRHTMRPGTMLIGTLALAALSGCSDTGSPAIPSPSHDAPFSASAEPLRDAGIDRGDTYLAFHVTTSVSAASPEGETGVLASVIPAEEEYEYAAPMESRYLEAGYEADGDLRFSVYREPSTNPRVPSPPSLMRAVENQVSIYDQSGLLVGSFHFNNFMEDFGFPGGTLANATPEGSLYTEDPKLLLPPADEPGGTTLASASASSGPRLRRVSDDVVEVVIGSPGATAVQASPESPTESVLRYRRRAVPVASGTAAGAGSGHRWMLEEVRRTALVQTPRGRAAMRSRSTYRYTMVHVNPGKDRQRARDRTRVPSGGGGEAARAAPAAAGEVVLASDDGINVCTREEYEQVRTVYSGGAGMVWQHGFCSGGSTFTALRQKVAESHRVGREQVYSLNPDAAIESQVSDLEFRMSAQGVPSNVIVGHSQGGLVARRLGQKRPDLVSGVVTIGSPHQGALIASRTPAVISDRLAGAVGPICFGNILCPLFREVLDHAGTGLLTWGVGELIPAAGDDRPGSPFLSALNTRFEKFRRAGIHVAIPNRWAIFRMVGDRESDRGRLLTGTTLKGENWANNVEKVYWAGWFLQDLAAAIRWWATDYGYGWSCGNSGYRTHWEPCYDPYGYSSRWWLQSYWLSVAGILDFIGRTVTYGLDKIDETWDDITTGRSGQSDGLIQYSSQVYPNTPGTYPPVTFAVPNSKESHLGETASVEVMRELRNALDHVGVPR